MKENKLIAEFMGVVFHDDENQYYNADGLHIGNTLQYHTSWDWLIPVVDKCFQEDGKHYVINDALLTINIDEVHEAVVKFIKEYNKKS